MSEYNWKPVLLHTAELECTITFEGLAKYQEQGATLTFHVLPNLGFAAPKTDVSEKAWEREVVRFVKEKAAELTGLEPSDFMLNGWWGVGPSLTVATLKKPLKLTEDLIVRMSVDGTEIAESLREARKGCVHIKGTLVSGHRAVGEDVEFWLPFDVHEVRLSFVAPHGYVLREEKNGQLGVRAWLEGVEPPKNMVSF